MERISWLIYYCWTTLDLRSWFGRSVRIWCWKGKEIVIWTLFIFLDLESVFLPSISLLMKVPSPFPSPLCTPGLLPLPSASIRCSYRGKIIMLLWIIYQCFFYLVAVKHMKPRVIIVIIYQCSYLLKNELVTEMIVCCCCSLLFYFYFRGALIV